MHRLPLFTLVFSALVLGCAVDRPLTDPGWQTRNVFHDNPVFLPVTDHEFVWETMVDVVDDYFQIKHEEPVRLVGDVPTEGRLDTFPAVGSTIFEPWRRDSASRYEKLESTLQSIRRHAVVRVWVPPQGGHLVDVAVYKELEDVVEPENASAGAATFRYDSSFTRVVSPVGSQEINDGWIPKGRDTALEQRILGQLIDRVGEAPIH
jgi:hypothetical protein